MKKEYELVVELCKFVRPNEDKIKFLLEQKPDMAYVLGLILINRMGGIAYETLQKTGILAKTNREFQSTLRAIYTANVERTIAYKDSLTDLSGVLAGIPIRYAVLKGAYLCGVYPIGLRTSNDIDILVNKDDIAVISERLLARCFKQGYVKNELFVPATRAEIISSRMNRGETVPFISKLGNPKMKYMEIDVNFSLDFQVKDEAGAVRSMLRKAEPLIKTGNGCLYTLCQEDFIIHLCAHLYKEATTYPWVSAGRDLSLYKFSDLYLLYENNIFASEESIQSLTNRIRDVGQEKECYYSIRNFCTLYGIQDKRIETLLSNLSIPDMSFMNRIYRADKKMYYQFHMDYVSWFFCPNRVDELQEVSKDATIAYEGTSI